MYNKQLKKNIAVLFGGKSVEHDISIITGVQTLNSLDITKYNIYPIYITKDNIFTISQNFFDIKFFTKGNITPKTKNIKQVQFSQDAFLYVTKGKKFVKFTKLDFVILCTHGGEGEKGSLQGLLDIYDIPYSSCDVFSSSICMNKVATKQLLLQNDINVVDYKTLSKSEYEKGNYLTKIKSLKYPLIVKPCNLGSSIGVTFCKNNNQLKNALSFAFLFDNQILIEQAVENLKEVNISVMGNSFENECSDIEEVLFQKDFLTFENKYLNKESSSKGMENTSRIIPANINEENKDKLIKIAQKTYSILNCKGVVRIDFLINTKTNQIYVNEVNTIPGSLSNYLWKNKGYSFNDLLEKVMEYSLSEYEKEKKKVVNFSSNVLSQFNDALKLKLTK